MRLKYRDPLHILLEYIAKVSALHVMFRFVTVLIPPRVQRAPACDMAVVHDDDLERILGVGDRTVSEDRESALLLISSCP